MLNVVAPVVLRVVVLPLLVESVVVLLVVVEVVFVVAVAEVVFTVPVVDVVVVADVVEVDVFDSDVVTVGVVVEAPLQTDDQSRQLSPYMSVSHWHGLFSL